jgi:hypothetical protein
MFKITFYNFSGFNCGDEYCSISKANLQLHLAPGEGRKSLKMCDLNHTGQAVLAAIHSFHYLIIL